MSTTQNGFGGPSGGDSSDVFSQVMEQFESVWNSLTSMSPQLNALPSELHDSLQELYNRLTNNGTLPILPSWKDLPVNWTDERTLSTTSQARIAAPHNSNPPSITAQTNTQVISNWIHRHPFWFFSILTSSTLGTAYYFFPAQTGHYLRPITSKLPASITSTLPHQMRKRLVSSKFQRPARHFQPGHIETRKEAILVLGCDTPTMSDLALDLEARGFVVIASVSNPNSVDSLERRSRGWMKVLVLDGNDATSVSPFLRSLNTALSLRFPLYSSGDPFSRPAHALSLTGVVNGLSIDSNQSGLVPVEGLEYESIKTFIGERIATVMGVLRGIIPILRSAASRPDAPKGVILTLASSVSPLSLPFVSLASASDAAIASLLESLKRELHSTTSPSNLRIKALSIGQLSVPTRAIPVEPLSTRLSSLYSSTLFIRSQALNRASTASPNHHRSSTRSFKRLHSRVFHILTDSTTSYLLPSFVGSRALVHSLAINYFPRLMTDFYLRFSDWLYKNYLDRRRVNAVGGATAVDKRSASQQPAPPEMNSQNDLPPYSTTHQNQTHNTRTDKFDHPASLRPGGRSNSTTTPLEQRSPPSISSSEEEEGSGTEDLFPSSHSSSSAAASNNDLNSSYIHI